MASTPRGPPIDRGWAWVVMIGFLAQNVLTTYISVRMTVMLGGFLASMGVILSVFATSIPILIVTQSLLIGCGNALIIGPGLVLVGTYFQKHRSLATAVVNTGANIGAIAMPPLIRYLLDEFGIRGVFLIYGALLLHIIAFGCLLRPIESYKGTSVVLNKTINSEIKDETERQMNPSENGIPEIKITAPEVTRLLSENEAEDAEKSRSRVTSASSRTFKDFIESYSESSAVKYSSTPDLACLSVQDIPSSKEDKQHGGDHCCMGCLEKTLDLSLFKKARFFLLLAIAAFGVLGGALMGIYIPVLGRDKNVSNVQATVMLSANGAAGAVSRIAVGFFADRGIMKRNHILALSLFIAGVTGLFTPLYQGFPILITFSIANGFFCALYFSLIPVIIVDFLGLDKLSKTFGFLQLIHGAALAAAHPVSGLLRDITGSFDVPYIFFGTSCLVAATLLMMEPCARRFDNRKYVDPELEETEANVHLTVNHQKV